MGSFPSFDAVTGPHCFTEAWSPHAVKTTIYRFTMFLSLSDAILCRLLHPSVP
jgi:hypothetical protein